MNSIEDLLELLGIQKKQPRQYLSVLDDHTMDNPRYRSYMEQEQGLGGVYPELLMMGRGSGPRAQLGGRAEIGSKVPQGYRPFTDMSQSEQRLAMLRQKNISRQNQEYIDPDFLKEFLNMALDRNRGTAGAFTLQHLFGNPPQK
jgi:hypothetical protein